ncbi:MAG: RNA-binding protein [uncultured Thiotrichaceae bacterium]|uniref:RNA-binding protein n=1 Tax=uncultured Thiotrichaceae bacterium TaxID=298394 RepID=A0A6S6RWZ5_9GAMM|nr:MAG: RNA-binding protein [uncultured Thiotrichaceae bacterium]
MKILVRNLSRSVTEAELKTIFEAFGTVQSCTLVMDKKTGGSKGFGFVAMPKVGEAKAAIKSLNGKKVGDEKMRVKKAEDRPETAPKRMGETVPESTETEAGSEEIVSAEKVQVEAKPQEKLAQKSQKHNPYGKSKR